MAGGGAIRVEGVKELNAALGKLNRSLQRDLQRELRAVAEPTAEGTRERASKFSAPTVAGIRAASRSGAALVRQRAGKTTGQRPDFAGIQMREAFLPALQAAEPETIRRLEEMLDRLAGSFTTTF